MKHIWDRRPDGEAFPGMKAKVWVCKRCGAEKVLANYKFSEPQYIRSGQIFTGQYLECFDMEAENNKIID